MNKAHSRSAAQRQRKRTAKAANRKHTQDMLPENIRRVKRAMRGFGGMERAKKLADELKVPQRVQIRLGLVQSAADARGQRLDEALEELFDRLGR